MIFKNKRLSHLLWDAWCIASIIGIWPRFIEPNLLATNYFKIKIANLPKGLEGLKIVQFSDLHWQAYFSFTMQKKLISRINAQKPDILVFTGDFLSRSKLEESAKLVEFLKSLHAKYGKFAILGNHDYAHFVTMNSQGQYDIEQSSSSDIIKGFKKLFRSRKKIRKITDAAKEVSFHPDLHSICEKSDFKILHNESLLLNLNYEMINIVGLGEYILDRCMPEQAFSNYNSNYPGIILTHNPDSISKILNYPGDLILAGHTHGGQVNLPGMWHKFAYLENKKWKSGLKNEQGKWIYINRGIGSVMPFRWFAMPEITVLTLSRK